MSMVRVGSSVKDTVGEAMASKVAITPAVQAQISRSIAAIQPELYVVRPESVKDPLRNFVQRSLQEGRSILRAIA